MTLGGQLHFGSDLTSFLCVNLSPSAGKAIASPDTGAHGHFPSGSGGELLFILQSMRSQGNFTPEEISSIPCFVWIFYFNNDCIYMTFRKSFNLIIENSCLYHALGKWIEIVFWRKSSVCFCPLEERWLVSYSVDLVRNWNKYRW